jgi:hypothetical protein
MVRGSEVTANISLTTEERMFMEESEKRGLCKSVMAGQPPMAQMNSGLLVIIISGCDDDLFHGIIPLSLISGPWGP